MKNFIFTTLIASFLMGFLAVPVLAQDRGLDRGQMKAMDDRRNEQIEKGIEKYLITFDYNSWFEKLTVMNTVGATQESQALYYGFGVGVEKNWYRPKWGWGMSGGYLAGSALGGDAGGSLSYFQSRVPWWAVRVTPRVFYRWTPRTDFGLDLSAFFKQGKWPTGTAGDLTVSSGSELITGAFVDMRVRFNVKLEMIQAFGMVYKDASIYWRLGLAYRL